MRGATAEELTIDRLMELGTVTYEATGWGTGEICVKCRSNTKSEQESLNKAVISFSVNENEVEQDTVDDCVRRELGKKLAAREVRVLSIEDKKYNLAKHKFRVWKNAYKNERRSEA